VIYLGALPFSQLECQKVALSPLPTVTIVEASKRSLSVLSQGISISAHGRCACCHRDHSQRSLNARAKRSKSRRPSPLNSLGAQVVGQLSRQCPPLIFWSCSFPEETLSHLINLS
jgi:hypothetical protein